MSLANSIFLYNIYFSLMKKLIIAICVFPSIIINAQIIDYNNFNKEIMNEVMFKEMNEYTSLEGEYSLTRSSAEHHKIYKLIKKNHEEFLLDDLSAKINKTIAVSSVGILDSISCKDIKGYKEIASRCTIYWSCSPSNAFFLIGWGKAVEVTSYYNKRSKTVYISCVFKN
jgi:hypothetical protein